MQYRSLFGQGKSASGDAKPRAVGIPSVVERVKAASAGPANLDMGVMYYIKGALSGGICCGITHGAVCPMDVVKTRMQLMPDVYNKGMIGGFRQVIAAEGVGALATGLGPTVVGYFIQGWFKFGGVELFKIQFVKALGEESAWNNRLPIYLASSAMAEFIADIFLCPLEATRIKLVSNPTFAASTPAAMALIAKQEGVMSGFYSGFGPILCKQVLSRSCKPLLVPNTPCHCQHSHWLRPPSTNEACSPVPPAHDTNILHRRHGWWRGLRGLTPPSLQVPYTMAKFAVQGYGAEKIYAAMETTPKQCSTGGNVAVSLASGTQPPHPSNTHQ